MRPSTSFEAILFGLLSAATGAACGASSGGPGDLSESDGAGDAASDSDGKRDGQTRVDSGADSAEGSTIDCKPPPPQITVVPMKLEYCYDVPDAGDAGPFAATCQIDCLKACMSASGLIPGPSDCSRLSETEVQCTRYYVCGRAPEGFPVLFEARTLGELLACYTTLEAAAVDAFERLATELIAHGAPETLVTAARKAADDERRHARVMSKLAAAHGGCPPPKASSPNHVRPLFAIALENAVEGCARETFGAVLALHQATHAPDAQLQRAMRGIASDEARHAELSWKVAAWLAPLLSESERVEVEWARKCACEELVQNDVLPVWRESGLPDPRTTRRLARAFATESAALGAAATRSMLREVA